MIGPDQEVDAPCIPGLLPRGLLEAWPQKPEPWEYLALKVVFFRHRQPT